MKYKQLVYLNGETEQQYSNYSTYDYKVKPYDILSIELTSLEQNTTQYFANPMANDNGSNQVSSALLFMRGFIVSGLGYVDLPMLGKVMVAGLTTREVKEKIDRNLEEYMKFASVSVKLINFRVTVFGEVVRPGVQYVYEEKFTLLQAIAQAGNLTEFGNAKEVKLVRETDEGPQIVYLDLTDPSIVSSEYYFLLPNDAIYVEPVRARAFTLNTRILSLTLSVASLGLAILTLINRN
ncbi:polysaccharide biosynthesis/export family protein [Catalinimonas alkaloidigena]|uniref:polysaccharide biosynthesis/export family protein n=1 Tax=Catalinimonas alkaloidigena TaxID=1075417 RepID=UPI0024069C22|nr:polysaccharide biosynthesis/export family protein [Catalinimonas alkaloidigena]